MILSTLDQEMTRLMLRPKPSDLCLETVQAWLVYAHWMPIDMTSNGPQSRFSEASAWQCLGLALRWATLLELDKHAPLAFDRMRNPSNFQPTAEDARAFRTMMYLIESDH